MSFLLLTSIAKYLDGLLTPEELSLELKSDGLHDTSAALTRAEV